MRIAVVSYGGLRCGLKHGHIQDWIDTFSEFFRENNEVDVFLMLNRKRNSPVEDVTDEEIQEIREIFGERLKILEFYEDQPKEVHELEETYFKEWEQLEQNVTLTDKEIEDFKQDLEKGMRMRQQRGFQFGDLHHVYQYLQVVSHWYIGSKTIKREKNMFVRKYLYRIMIANNLRKKYEKDNNIAYDWVTISNIFQDIFVKRKTIDVFLSPPQPSTVYGHIASFVASSPSIIDNIFDNLGHNYPIKKDWSLWHDERFKREMVKWDTHIYYLRHVYWTTEYQVFWQIMQSAKYFVNLRISGRIEEPNICPDAYFDVHACVDRRNHG